MFLPLVLYEAGGIFMRVSNEPCTDMTDDSRWELAHTRMTDGLDAYGECRDSERTQFVSMSAWLILTPLAQSVRAAAL